MWLVGKTNGQKTQGYCLKTCPFLHQGNCWNDIWKLILPALDCELPAHPLVPSGPGTHRHSELLLSPAPHYSVRKPWLHSLCLKVTFNLLSKQLLAHRASDDWPSFHLASYLAPKASKQAPSAIPPTLSVDLSPRNFSLELGKGSLQGKRQQPNEASY